MRSPVKLLLELQGSGDLPALVAGCCAKYMKSEKPELPLYCTLQIWSGSLVLHDLCWGEKSLSSADRPENESGGDTESSCGQAERERGGTPVRPPRWLILPGLVSWTVTAVGSRGSHRCWISFPTGEVTMELSGREGHSLGTAYISFHPLPLSGMAGHPPLWGGCQATLGFCFPTYRMIDQWRHLPQVEYVG